MNLRDEQIILHKIVKTWCLSEKPEYRGFRCANCQQYINEAWHHWLNSNGYILPVHMCDITCERLFQNNAIKIDETKIRKINRQLFGTSYVYTEITIKRFKEIVASWPNYMAPKLKKYNCDECNIELDIDEKDGLRKGYHVWWKMDDGITLAELHFHKKCANKLGIL